MKDIIIIAEFCGDFSSSDNSRFLYLAKLLSKENNVEIITSNFFHQTKKRRDHHQYDYDFLLTLIDEPGYSKNICLKRFYSHYIWGKRVLEYLRNRKTKPDVVYCAVPSLTGANRVAKYCNHRKIPFIIDIQDLWTEAFQMVFNVPIISNMIFFPFSLLVNNIYKRADKICAVSDTYVKRALKVNQKCPEGTNVFLGTDLDTFDKYARMSPIFKKPKDKIWIAYCGTLGSSYDISCVINALGLVGDNRITFVVMGDGPHKKKFEILAKRKKIQMIFAGRLRYDRMCSLLAECDFAVNPIRHRAAQSIINKHADYAAAGIPVLNTQENQEYRELVETFHMGINCNNNDPVDLARCIKELVMNKTLREEMGKNARRCAEEKFDRKITYCQLIALIEE